MPPEPELLDLVVRGGRFVTPEGVHEAELGILHGRIVRVVPEIADPARLTLEAHGRYVFPGIIDAQVHFDESGQAEEEDLAHGSLALAAGGGTCFFDLPLNSDPPVLDAAGLREKRARAEQQSCTDFALWGGLVPGNLDRLAGLRDAGAIGLMAFMGASGPGNIPPADAATLHAGMKRAAKLGMLMAVHAEDGERVAKFTAEQQAKGRHDARAWLASRPVEAELTAIRQALEIAGETGCALHLVQVSSPEGIALITEARANRVDVTAETCPHYLLFNDRDAVRLGATAQADPPLRAEKSRVALWGELRAGHIQTVASAHSPAPPAARDCFTARHGIAGVQHGFPLLLNACAATADRDLPLLAAVLARNVARRFRLDGRKGLLAVGHDADFSLVEFGPRHTIEAEELWTRHRISPYVRQTSRVNVTHTYIRGRPVWADGGVASGAPKGQFVRPIHHP